MNNKQSKQNSNPYKITFDADARKEFILGVKKRKNERRQQYLEAKARKEHRDKLERRRQVQQLVKNNYKLFIVEITTVWRRWTSSD